MRDTIIYMKLDQIEGLSAGEVARRRRQFGYNELPDRGRKNIVKLIFSLIKEPMIFLLLSTVCIYFCLGDRNEAFLLFISFVGIIAIELYQESKTEKSLEALKNLSSPISDVIREGQRVTIPGREVVVGDIVLLFEGSRVPADAKLISADNLKIDESLLTGESEPVEKHIRDIKDFRTNSVFSGTLVVKGHGVAEVTGVGRYTEMGKIGTSLKSISTEKTLLQKEVNKAIRVVASIAICCSVLLTLVYWIQRGDLTRGFLAGLTLAIAILPEEFPVILTIFLTLGAWRLAKSKILTRRAHTIETLGSATVLCVDKTGTLTENKMEIIASVDANGVLSEGFGHSTEIIKYGILASQRHPFDPMEEAFIEAGRLIFKNLDKIYGHQDIIKEYPLEDKMFSVVHVWGRGDRIESVALKGAPETVFDLCKIDSEKRKRFEQEAKNLADRGLRVIAVAKAVGANVIHEKRHGYKFELLGLVGLADPIRREAKSAVKLCKDAGIRVVMITGDYPVTAMNIAKQIGLESENIITGVDFEKMSRSARREAVKTASVFSRVSPSHKLMIVKTLKEIGAVVAMTGDGVNDAPALKAAHVGVAMGKHGTDVAREAASIVLLDDNFASIVRGVRLGRRIYDNLRKAMSYIISIHIPIASLSLLPVLFGWPLVLVPIHIVFLEFVIDPSCTIIFENEKEEDNIMQRPPRKLSESIFNYRMVLGSIFRGTVVAIAVVAIFKILLNIGWSQDKARGMVFLILIVANILLILLLSGRQAINNIVHRENMAMLTILFVTSLSLLIIFNAQILRELFHFCPLSPLEALVGVLIGIVSVLCTIPISRLVKKIL
jgi:Ca2+-transporting ATPase